MSEIVREIHKTSFKRESSNVTVLMHACPSERPHYLTQSLPVFPLLLY